MAPAVTFRTGPKLSNAALGHTSSKAKRATKKKKSFERNLWRNKVWGKDFRGSVGILGELPLAILGDERNCSQRNPFWGNMGNWYQRNIDRGLKVNDFFFVRGVSMQLDLRVEEFDLRTFKIRNFEVCGEWECKIWNFFNIEKRIETYWWSIHISFLHRIVITS